MQCISLFGYKAKGTANGTVIYWDRVLENGDYAAAYHRLSVLKLLFGLLLPDTLCEQHFFNIANAAGKWISFYDMD